MTEPNRPGVHTASAYRRSTGWLRWFAACTCGFRVDAKSREDAYGIAHRHELAKQAVQQ